MRSNNDRSLQMGSGGGPETGIYTTWSGLMELEQAIDKAVEAVSLQSLKPLQRHVVCVTGMAFL